jgi:hypothetical protein
MYIYSYITRQVQPGHESGTWTFSVYDKIHTRSLYSIQSACRNEGPATGTQLPQILIASTFLRADIFLDFLLRFIFSVHTLIYFCATPPLLSLGFFTTMSGSLPPLDSSSKNSLRTNVKTNLNNYINSRFFILICSYLSSSSQSQFV